PSSIFSSSFLCAGSIETTVAFVENVSTIVCPPKPAPPPSCANVRTFSSVVACHELEHEIMNKPAIPTAGRRTAPVNLCLCRKMLTFALVLFTASVYLPPRSPSPLSPALERHHRYLLRPN